MSKSQESTPANMDEFIHVSSHSTFNLLFAMALIAVGIIVWCICGTVTDKKYLKGVVFPSNGTIGVNVPNNGVVRSIFVHKGDRIVTGQPLALVSVSGSYSVLSAPSDGVVLSYLTENEPFEAFEDIVDLLSNEDQSSVRFLTSFADFSTQRFLKPGQPAQVTPTNETRERVGFVEATIKSISPYPISKHEAILKLQNESLAEEIFPDAGSVFYVEIEMVEDPMDPQGLKWSFSHKDEIDMGVGTFCDIEVVVKSRSVFEYLMENVQETRNKVKLWAK